ncbi:type 1 glutamine amidotransferase [Prauserella flavalba]|uniref:type 1 glutamine amidotransferase n=1 Tax=Prauserella flavalba TaxID=1477506 RepID=UPI0036E77C92
MKPIAVITHVDRADVGLVAELARERGIALQLVRPYRGDELPPLDRVGAVVAMGGPQSAYDDHPYLREEQRYLAAAVGDDVAVLAICLGSQLLARALGGSAEPGDSGLEAGMITVKPAEGATTEVAGEFFSFHSDSATPPEYAEILARSDRYLQAWSAGSALAVQFHPEITMRGIGGLLAVEGPKLERFGVDVATMRRDAEGYFADGADDSRTLLNRWFDRLSR